MTNLRIDRVGSNRREFGAHMVEFAMILPVLMGTIMGLLWLAHADNQKSGFIFSVARGVRLAATRGDEAKTGVAIIDDLNTYYTSGYASQHVIDLLSTKDQDWSKAVDYYKTHSVQPVFPKHDLSTMPPAYTYALAYLYESIRDQLGSAVHFPCDPTAADGHGCLSCVFVHPSLLDTSMTWGSCDTCTPADPLPTLDKFGNPVEPPPPATQIAIQCTLNPPDNFLTSASRLINLSAGNPSGTVKPNILRHTFLMDQDSFFIDGSVLGLFAPDPANEDIDDGLAE